MHLPEPPELLEFLAPDPSATEHLLLELRKRLIALLPNCIEVVWDATNTVGTAYAYAERNRDHFIHLPAYAHYVNLGFAFGA